MRGFVRNGAQRDVSNFTGMPSLKSAMGAGDGGIVSRQNVAKGQTTSFLLFVGGVMEFAKNHVAKDDENLAESIEVDDRTVRRYWNG